MGIIGDIAGGIASHPGIAAGVVGGALVGKALGISGRTHFELDVIEIPAVEAVRLDLRERKDVDALEEIVCMYEAMAEGFRGLVDSARAQLDTLPEFEPSEQ